MFILREIVIVFQKNNFKAEDEEIRNTNEIVPNFEFRISSKDEIMPTLIETPSIVKAAGNKPKVIVEYIGRVNSQTEEVSLARMKSPSGWAEPGQQPEFDEYTLVLNGMLRVKTKESTIDVQAGQAIITHRGEWVQYSTPEPEGADYISVCLPAFSSDMAHRDEETSDD